MKTQGKSRGRPSRYRPEYVEKARTLAEVGLTQEEIAHQLDVHPEHAPQLVAARPEVADAVRTGAARADQRVENALPRSCGFASLALHELVNGQFDPESNSCISRNPVVKNCLLPRPSGARWGWPG